MPFHNSKDDSGAQVIRFEGRITFGRETDACRQFLKRLLADGEREFIFDLTRVEYIDSAGIGFLVSCLTTLAHDGASLRLASPPARVQYVLGITKLYTVFQIFPTLDQALQNRP
jgi:anti-sigma B factor antagonist